VSKARAVRRSASLSSVLIAFAIGGCAPALHSVRLRTAEGREWTAVPRPHPAVAITEEEFQRATVSLARDVAPVADPLEYARQLFEVPVRSGWFFYDPRTKQLAPLDPGAAAGFLPAEVVGLTRSYMQWCHNRQEPGDCLRLLRHAYALDADARLAVAMDIALGSVMEAIAESLEGVANREAVWSMIVARAVMYGVLLAAPEPISKLIAAGVTAALVVYLGVDTIYSLRDGWRRLVARADAAETFDELRAAGEQFGKLMGANTARVLVMVAAAAVGSRAGDVAKVLPKLPGMGQALRFATADGVEVEAVQTVTIAKSGITLTLAPGAVAASTIGTHSGEDNPGPRPSAAASGSESTASSGLRRVGVEQRVLPENARVLKDWGEVVRRLEKYNDISPELASERLHAIKQAAGRGPADNVIFDLSGGVYDPVTREWLGSLTEGGVK